MSNEVKPVYRSGAYLRFERKAHNLSLRALADELGVSHVFAGAVEQGEKKIPYGWTMDGKLAAALPNMSMERLRAFIVEGNQERWAAGRTKSVEESEKSIARFSRAHRAGMLTGLRMGWEYHRKNPTLSSMEVFETCIMDVDAFSEVPTNLEHVAAELDSWIEMALDVIDPPEPCAYVELRDMIAARLKATCTECNGTGVSPLPMGNGTTGLYPCETCTAAPPAATDGRRGER